MSSESARNLARRINRRSPMPILATKPVKTHARVCFFVIPPMGPGTRLHRRPCRHPGSGSYPLIPLVRSKYSGRTDKQCKRMYVPIIRRSEWILKKISPCGLIRTVGRPSSPARSHRLKPAARVRRGPCVRNGKACGLRTAPSPLCNGPPLKVTMNLPYPIDPMRPGRHRMRVPPYSGDS